MPTVLLLATQVYGSHGGIQTYTRRIAEICSRWARNEGSRFICVSLCDTDCDLTRHEESVEYHEFVPCSNSKIRFVSTALRLARANPGSVLVVGHLALSPVAALLKVACSARADVLALHGLEAWEKLALVERLSVRTSSSIVATTRYTADLFSQLNAVDSRRVCVIPIGLLRRQASGVSEPQPAAPPRILTVSRLSRHDAYKGIDVLIRALALLKSRGHHVVLDVVGDGDDRSRLENLAASLSLATSVQFHASVSDSQMNDFYARCTLFALPSRREGFGIVFLEAMLHGKPCVGGRHGGTPEVIDHESTGYLVSHGDVTELAARLSDLLEGAHRAGRMGALGLAKVETVYRFDQMQAAWVNVMKGALNGASA